MGDELPPPQGKPQGEGERDQQGPAQVEDYGLPQPLPVPPSYGAPHHGFHRVGKTVQPVGDQHQEVEQHRIGGHRHVPQPGTLQGHEGETELQAEGADEDVPIQAEQPPHRGPLPPARPGALPHLGREMAQAAAHQPEPHPERAVVRQQGGGSHPPDLPAQPQHEPGIQHHVDQVAQDQQQHGAARILHAQQPAHDDQVAQGRRGAPDPHRDIVSGIALHFGGSPAEPYDGRQERQHQQQQGQPQPDGEAERPRQGVQLPLGAGGALGLGGQTRSGHAQEAEQPEQEVDEGRPDRDTSEKPGLPEMTDHPGIHQAEQGGGDVGEHHGQGQGKHGTVAARIPEPGRHQARHDRGWQLTRRPAALCGRSRRPWSAYPHGPLPPGRPWGGTWPPASPRD
ncbi:hypothetical protein D3C72_1171100 [compost metagenome]